MFNDYAVGRIYYKPSVTGELTGSYKECHTIVGVIAARNVYFHDDLGADIRYISVIYDFASIAAGDTFSHDFTFTGAETEDFLIASCAASIGGLVQSAVVSATNTATVTLYNPTAGAIDVSNTAWRFIAIPHDRWV